MLSRRGLPIRRSVTDTPSKCPGLLLFVYSIDSMLLLSNSTNYILLFYFSFIMTAVVVILFHHPLFAENRQYGRTVRQHEVLL